MTDQPPLHGDLRALTSCKAFYFLYYAAFTCIFPYLVLYYESRGLVGWQIGALMAIPYFLLPVSAPLFGALCDLTGKQKPLLLGLVIGVGSVMFGISQATSFAAFVVLVVLYALFNGPIIPIIDNATLDALGEHRARYGLTRLWGSLGWGLFAPFAGWAMGRFGAHVGFYGFFFFIFITLIAAAVLPVNRAPSVGRFWNHVGVFMRNRRWLHFLVAVFFSGIGMAMINSLLFLHLEHLGIRRMTMGFTQTFSIISETFFLFVSARLLRFGPQRLFNVSMILLVVRILGLSFASEAWHVMGLQLLHGCTYATMLAAGVTYAHVTAPRGLGTTGQGIFTGVFNGLGCGVGALVGGWVYQNYGSVLMLRFGAAVVTFGLLVYVIMGLTIPGMRLALPKNLVRTAARHEMEMDAKP